MQRQTKKELTQTQAVVAYILERYPRARDNDDLLYYLVCRERAKGDGMNIDKMPFRVILTGGWQWLPRFESVVRLRRLVQRHNPQLKPAKPVKRGRRRKEADFVELNRKARAGKWQ